MYSKRITELKEPLDIDLQLLATEMDTSAKRNKPEKNEPTQA